MVQGSFAASQLLFSDIGAVLKAGVGVDPFVGPALYPCLRLNCQYQPAEASVLSVAELA